MKKSDIKKYGPPVTLALIMVLVGFWLFIKPHLGTRVAYPPVIADAQTKSLAAGATSLQSPNAQADALTALAKKDGLSLQVTTVSVASHVAGGAANQIVFQIGGNATKTLNFLAALAGQVYIDGRQVRGSGGNLYLINALDCEADSNTCSVTVLIPTLNSTSPTTTTTTTTSSASTTTTPPTTTATTPLHH